MSYIALITARELHKSLIIAKATVQETAASTPPSVRRYAQYQQLIADYDMRISELNAKINELEEEVEKIVIAETETNKAKLAAVELEEPDTELTEAVYSAILNSAE